MQVITTESAQRLLGAKWPREDTRGQARQQLLRSALPELNIEFVAGLALVHRWCQQDVALCVV